MKTLLSLFTTMFLFACNTAPAIVPDSTSESVLMKKLNYDITHDNKVSNWGWILWYLPVVVMLAAWAWKEWIRPSLDATPPADKKV